MESKHVRKSIGLSYHIKAEVWAEMFWDVWYWKKYILFQVTTSLKCYWEKNRLCMHSLSILIAPEIMFSVCPAMQSEISMGVVLAREEESHAQASKGLEKKWADEFGRGNLFVPKLCIQSWKKTNQVSCEGCILDTIGKDRRHASFSFSNGPR